MRVFPIIVAGALFAGSAIAADKSGGKPKDVPTGNMAQAVSTMDSNGDGRIVRDEYLAYAGSQYDHDAARVPTGDMTEAVRVSEASKRAAYMDQRAAYFGKAKGKSKDGLSSDEMLDYLKSPSSEPAPR